MTAISFDYGSVVFCDWITAHSSYTHYFSDLERFMVGYSLLITRMTEKAPLLDSNASELAVSSESSCGVAAQIESISFSVAGFSPQRQQQPSPIEAPSCCRISCNSKHSNGCCDHNFLLSISTGKDVSDD